MVAVRGDTASLYIPPQGEWAAMTQEQQQHKCWTHLRDMTHVSGVTGASKAPTPGTQQNANTAVSVSQVSTAGHSNSTQNSFFGGRAAYCNPSQ